MNRARLQFTLVAMTVHDGPPADAPAQGEDSNRFRSVESAVVFRRVTCHRCDFNSIYKYKVRQIRRKPEPETGPEEEVRPDHLEIWAAIPRFAEIPETVKCKRCGEVLGLYTECLF